MDAVDAQKREAHRALGRHIETFSHLMFQMRLLMNMRLTMPAYDINLGELVLGQVTAGLIADSFFGMCRYLGKLDDAEKNIANQLHNEVIEAIKERNNIVHGDWFTTPEWSPPVEPDAAQLVRYYPSNRDGLFERIEPYTAEKLDAMSDRIFALRVHLSDFGRCALGLAMLKADGTIAEPGAYRVGDILKAENVPRSGKGGAVARTGPRAAEVAEGPVYT